MSLETSLLPTTFTSPQQLIDALSSLALNVDLVYQYTATNTLYQLYEQLSQEVVYCLMMIPYNQVQAGIDPNEDDGEQQLIEAAVTAASSIALICSKPQQEVEQRLAKLIRQFPLSDLKQAAMLRRNNQLH